MISPKTVVPSPKAPAKPVAIEAPKAAPAPAPQPPKQQAPDAEKQATLDKYAEMLNTNL
jgi:hypothetical protein